MRVRRVSIWIPLIAVAFVTTPTVQAQDAAPQSESRRPDVIYVPTPTKVVSEMLKMADVSKDDVVYDLGCGDGRIVIAAARDHGARGVGIDIDPKRIAEAKTNAADAGVDGRVEFREEDLFQADISEATVVTLCLLYLLPSLNLKLMPKLKTELRPGTRVVSHAFDMGNWEPEKTATVEGRRVYFWTIPEQ